MKNGMTLRIYIDDEVIEGTVPYEFEDSEPLFGEDWESKTKTFEFTYKSPEWIIEEEYIQLALVLNYIMYYQYFN